MTKKSPATSELEIHILDPFKTKSVPSLFAVVFIANASEPDVVSDKAKLLHYNNKSNT